MGYLMSIDLGTSSVRVMIMREDGTNMTTCGESYDINIPKTGFAEQNPELWYEKTVVAIRRCMQEATINKDEIRALSFSGQMHGLVCLGKSKESICPAILWPDQRTAKLIPEIYDKLGRDFIASRTQNTITTGFLIASLYWIYKYSMELYEKIDKVMLPKDYIKFRLTKEIVTDYSDAAGSLAFDNENLCWAKDLIEGLGLRYEIFPKCKKSTYVVGTICKQASKDTGLPTSIKVINGGSDQCMQGIGNAIIKDGVFASNIGTGGQISTSVSSPVFDLGLRTNTFAHVIEGRWNIMGAALSSGASLKWLTKNIIGITDYDILNIEGSRLSPGCEGLLFLPYLSGERTPYQDPDARGVFCGLTMKHHRFHMARAVMEGVIYSLKDCMEVVTGMGVICDRVIASGGGANSELWLQMQADILERDIYKSKTSEQACVGAAITAGVGVDVYDNFSQACGKLVKLDKKIYYPIDKNVSTYRSYYEIFQELYITNRKLFKQISKLEEKES